MEPTDTPPLSRILEAMLFVAEQPLSLEDLMEVASRDDYPPPAPSQDAITAALAELQRRCQEEGRAYELRELAGGWQLLTAPALESYAKLLVLQTNQKKLSRSALETLAIVAYKQPIVKSEIEFIRGVGCDYAIQKLLEKGLIEPAGRANLPGKPLQYRTTRAFMDHFGLKNLADLPKLDELNHDAETVAEAYRNALLENPDAAPTPPNGGGSTGSPTTPTNGRPEPQGNQPEADPADAP